MIFLGILLGIISAFFWAAWIVTSSAILSAGYLEYADLLFIRYIAPCVLGLIFLCFVFRSLHKYHLATIIIASFFGATIYPAFALMGFSYMSGWKAGIILNSAIPVFTFLLVTYFKKFNKFALISVFLIVCGNLLLIMKVGVNATGCIMILISAAGMSIYLFMVGSKNIPIHIIMAIMPIVGCISIAPYLIFHGVSIENISNAGLKMVLGIIVLHGILSGFVATLLLTISSKITGPQTASLAAALVPSMAVLIDYYIINTGVIDYRGFISLILCTSGIIIYGLWGKPSPLRITSHKRK